MLSRRHRFHGLHSLDSVYRRGQTIRGPFCLVRHITNPRRQDYRLAVVVSKKVHKSAVVRNRIRRRVYAIAGDCQLAPGQDIIITVFDEMVATVAADKLQKAISQQLKPLSVAA